MRNKSERVLLGTIAYVVANPFAWIAIACIYTAITGK